MRCTKIQRTSVPRSKVTQIRLLGVMAFCMTIGLTANSFAQGSWSLKDNTSFAPPAEVRPLAKPPTLSGSQTKSSNQFGAPPASGSTRSPSRPANRSPTKPTPPSSSRSAAAANESHVDLDTCIVSFIEDIELPAQESGVLRTMELKEGQAFQKGQGIAQIDDQMYRQLYRQAQMQLRMAQKRATDQTSIRAGKYKVKLATVEAEKAQKLLSKGAKSESEYRRARYSQKVAQEELIAAENEREMAGNEAQLEQAKLEEVKVRILRHSIRTGFDGYVVKKFRDAGEWVQAGEKIARVARMDRLYVQGNISGKNYNPYEVANKPVTVTLKLARGKTTTFEGRIVSVGLERQGSDLFMVKAEVNNRPQEGYWTLMPGSQVKMRIHLNGKPQTAQGTAAKTKPVSQR